VKGTAAGTPTIGRYLRHDVVTTTSTNPSLMSVFAWPRARMTSRWS